MAAALDYLNQAWKQLLAYHTVLCVGSQPKLVTSTYKRSDPKLKNQSSGQLCMTLLHKKQKGKWWWPKHDLSLASIRKNVHGDYRHSVQFRNAKQIAALAGQAGVQKFFCTLTRLLASYLRGVGYKFSSVTWQKVKMEQSTFQLHTEVSL